MARRISSQVDLKRVRRWCSRTDEERSIEMNDTVTTPLPGSWLASRLGVDPREIEQLRERGELFAVRGQDEWLYPAWQFGPGGSIPAGVRNAVKAARALGIDEARLVTLLRRPVGLIGGARLIDLLFEGRSDYVLDAVRNAAAA
jgi:hypothetical protein